MADKKRHVLTPYDLPDRQYLKGPDSPLRSQQPLTEPNLRRVLAFLDYSLRFNMQLGTVEYLHGGVELEPLQQDRAYIEIKDTLKMVDIKALADLDFMLSTLAQEAPYHPMQAWLSRLPAWDGHDYLGDLIASVTTECELWPAYLENWLIQVIEGVCGWAGVDTDRPRGLPYVLVLVGGQGLGKTRWLDNLGGRWIRTEAELYLGTASGKDNQIEALRWPMVELAELDGIFRKADVAHLKGFISRSWDAIREPYARKAVGRPRMTSFCGSVNEAEFLKDPTGSRRFWPVAVDAIAWDFAMDWDQLWAQMYELWQEDSRFDLTPREEAARVAYAEDLYMSLPPEVEKVVEYYKAHKHLEKTFQPMNRTEIFEMVFGRVPSAAQAAQLGICLEKLCGKRRTLGDKQRAWSFPFNEFAVDRGTWPKKRGPDLKLV